MDESNHVREKGGFFAIDRRTWARVCSLGSNEAAAYLTIAQGTGIENRFSSWSATALKEHTGIAWVRGKAAIDHLVACSVVRYAENHSVQHPRYELPNWDEIQGIERSATEGRVKALVGRDKILLEEVRRGEVSRLTKSKRAALNSLVERGVVEAHGAWDYRAKSLMMDPAEKAPDLIWLPNTIVVGTDSGEPSPVRRLRSRPEVWDLRLFIDLYHSQNLRDDGGISPKTVCETYERKQIGQQGFFKVWGFRQKHRTVSWEGLLAGHRTRKSKEPTDNHPIWDSFDVLCGHGLLSFVPHLWENATQQAEIIHPYGISRIGGEAAEVQLGTSAHETAWQMALPEKREAAMNEHFYYLAPVESNYPDVQMIGVARLKYRPRTNRTGQWHQELVGNAPKWIARYAALKEKADGAARWADFGMVEGSRP